MALLAIVIIVVIAVAGAGAYLALSHSSSSSPTSTTSQPSSTTTVQTTTSTPKSTTLATTTSTIPPPTTTTTSSAPTTTTTAPTTTTTTTVPPTTTTTTTTTSVASTTSAFTCTSTTTTSTTTTTTDYTDQYIGLIKEFSSIEFKINGTSGGQSENETFGYSTSAVSSGIYNVSITSSAITTGSFNFIVDTNNDTVLSADLTGYVVTGSTAKTEFDSFMGLFGLEEYYNGEIGVFTDPAYFTNEGTSTQTFGTVSFQVTTYGLTSPNEVVNYCGVSDTINSYQLSVGTPPGTTLLFITYLEFSGTSQGESSNIVFQLVSMTLQG